MALVAILMALNSIRVYGFLSRAHVEHALTGDVKVSGAASHIDAQLDAKQTDLDDIKAASPSSTRPGRYRERDDDDGRRVRAPVTREPRINLDRLVSQIVLDCSLLRWFAFNRRRYDIPAAIELQRTRAKDTEGKSWTSWSGTAAANNKVAEIDKSRRERSGITQTAH